MGLFYKVQQPHVAIGSKSGDTITESTLTTAYSGNTSSAIDTGKASKVNLYVQYTSAGAGNSIQIRLRTRPKADGTNWYELVNESVSGGTSTLDEKEFTFETSGNGNTDNIVIPVDISDNAVEVAIKETVAAGSAGSVFCEVMTSGI